MTNKKLVFGVGINDANYAISSREELAKGKDGKRNRKVVWECPYYKKWTDMLKRCYCEKYQKLQKTYIGCSVCDEWLYFTNFRNWMITQDWEGKQLDKDVLVQGNKIYGPDTCIFVSRHINMLFVDFSDRLGSYLEGVSLQSNKKSFVARCRIFGGKRKNLGSFKTQEEAYEVFLKEKIKQLSLIFAAEEDMRVREAIEKKIKGYEKEIIINLK